MNSYKDLDRTYRLWQYTVAHSSLLIRSPADGSTEKSIDVSFFGVEYVRLPSRFEGLSVDAVSAQDVRREAGGPFGANTVGFSLVGGDGSSGFVVALAFTVNSHENSFMWSPFEIG